MADRFDRPYARRATYTHEGEGSAGPKRFLDYPRGGRRGVRRWLPSWKQLLSLCLLGVAGVAALVGVAYARTSVPDPRDEISAQVTIVYWDDGKTELGRWDSTNRFIIPSSAMPRHLKDAVIAAEDRSFYTNSGVSPKGIARAAVNNLRGRPLQGGSTITQQYVKNSFLSSDRTMKRKFKELFVAVKVARDVDKDVLLTNYLNTIYFGRQTYGVEAASQSYFGKPASKLTVSESAFLAGIINGPELYDPDDGKASRAKAVVRWNYVLDGLVSSGKITAAERAELRFPKVNKKRSDDARLKGQSKYLMDAVRDELTNVRGFKARDLDAGGLRITTTFNKRLVDQGVDSVKRIMPANAPKTWQVGIASVDPATGAVKALYNGDGSRDLSTARQSLTQAGSTFKPFALAAALKEGISLKSTWDGHSPQEFKGYPKPVRNFGNHSFGKVDLVLATEDSINTVYMGINEKIGADKTCHMAIATGIRESTLKTSGTDFCNAMGNVLGIADVYPIDMATAYSTFAAQGQPHERHYVQKVTLPNKGTAYRFKDPGLDRAFDSGVAADAVYAMRQVVEGSHGTGRYGRAVGRPVAGKTGTTSSSDPEKRPYDTRAAWFVGFTPQLSTSVALFNMKKSGASEDLHPIEGHRTITGGSYPLQVWTDYMKAAVDGMPVKDFPEPKWIGSTKDAESDEGDGRDLPTTRDRQPSATRDATTGPTATGEPDPTATAGEPTGDPEPSPTGDGGEPTRTREPEPTRTRPTEEPPKTTGPPPEPSKSAEADATG